MTIEQLKNIIEDSRRWSYSWELGSSDVLPGKLSFNNDDVGILDDIWGCISLEFPQRWLDEVAEGPSPDDPDCEDYEEFLAYLCDVDVKISKGREVTSLVADLDPDKMTADEAAIYILNRAIDGSDWQLYGDGILGIFSNVDPEHRGEVVTFWITTDTGTYNTPISPSRGVNFGEFIEFSYKNKIQRQRWGRGVDPYEAAIPYYIEDMQELVKHIIRFIGRGLWVDL